VIDIKRILHNPAEMAANIAERKVNANLDQVISLYQSYLTASGELQEQQARSNQIAKATPKADAENRARLIEEARQVRQRIAETKHTSDALRIEFMEAASTLPNWMSPEVPRGDTDHDNLEVKRYLEPTQFSFQPKDHLEIGSKLGLIDFESGAKVAGSKFYFLKREAVLLQHAIKSFAFAKAIEKGFICVQTPDIARNSILKGVGFNPRGESSNTYELEGMDASLIATAEIAVGGMHAEEVLDLTDGPILYAAESHCFRRESGSSGQSSKGLYRVHQFEKVELFAFATPEQSEEVHQKILALEEEIYQDLGVPYRVVLNCSGDLGAPAYKKYDIEAWMPGKGENGEYGEVTSASNCTDYQARRLNIKYKSDAGKNEYAHTLNGTAVALSRTLVAILENYQTAEGGVKIPEVLRPYMRINEIKPAQDTLSRTRAQTQDIAQARFG